MVRRKFTRYATITAALVLFASLYSCGFLIGAGAAGGAAYVYNEGWVERDYKVGLTQAYEAGLQAAEEMGLSVTEKNREVASAEIRARQGEQDYWIKMEEKSNGFTSVSVRSGLMGNQDASRKIHEHLNENL